MKRGSFSVGLLLLAACGDPEPSRGPEATAPTEVDEAEPMESAHEGPHHGALVAIDPHVVEVVVHHEGEVEAYFVSTDPPPHTHVLLTARLPGDDGAIHPLILTWNPTEERYEGRMRDARPLPGAVEVVLDIDGRITRGRASSVVVLGLTGEPEPARPPRRPIARAPDEVPTPEPPVEPPTPRSTDSLRDLPTAADPTTEGPAPTRVVLHGRTERRDPEPASTIPRRRIVRTENER